MRLLFTSVVLIVQATLGACGASNQEDLKQAVRAVLTDIGACTVHRLMRAEGETLVVVGGELPPEESQEDNYNEHEQSE